jgi:hypothetical protein
MVLITGWSSVLEQTVTWASDVLGLIKLEPGYAGFDAKAGPGHL